MRTRRRLSGLAWAVALVALPAQAQEADTLAVPPPADSVTVPTDSLTVPADSLAIPADSAAAAPAPRRAVGFVEPEAGDVVTAIPTRRPVFSVAELLGGLPGTFHYDLGVPGWPEGIAFAALAPDRASVTLSGVPVHDVFSGRPAWELLPVDLLTPVRLRPHWGAAAGVAADLRAFAAPVPITELRFRTGGTGIQFISATHAQTRRPGWLRRLGGDRSRLQVLAHVSGREADGEFDNFDLRGWQVVGRAGVALPAFSLEVTERHGRTRAGAPSDANVQAATPDERRETIRNDLAATLRLSLFAAPFTATAFWTAETFRTVDPLGALPTPDDTLTVRGDRIGLRLAQPFRIGRHRLAAEGTAWIDRADAGPSLLDPDDRSVLHAALRDSLTLGRFDLVAEAGLLADDAGAAPVAGVRIARAVGRLHVFLAAHRGAVSESRFERDGYAELLAAQTGGRERTLSLSAGLDAELGPFDLGLSAWALQRTDPRVLVETDTVATFISAEGAFRSTTGSLRLGWRDRARRGVYVRTTANAHAASDPDASDLHERLADALPPLWGDARLGFRALGLFDDNLDLDLAVRGRFWTAFRGRTFQALTSLYALPPTSAQPNDAGGTLDLVVEAGIGGGRATVFVLYENLLTGRAYNEAVVVPGYPLPSPRLRFGVFWLLPN